MVKTNTAPFFFCILRLYPTPKLPIGKRLVVGLFVGFLFLLRHFRQFIRHVHHHIIRYGVAPHLCASLRVYRIRGV